MVKIIMAIVSVAILSFVGGMYFMQAGDDEVTTIQSTPIEWENPKFDGIRSMITLRGLTTEYRGFVHVYKVNGELRCETDKGIVTLVGQLEGNDPKLAVNGSNGNWMTSRLSYIAGGPIDRDEDFFQSWYEAQKMGLNSPLPDVHTSYSCTGLGYYK